jgi:transcriptional regulator with XRE-family HTH domain
MNLGRFKDLLDKLSPHDPKPGEMVRTFRKQLALTLKDVEKITGIQEANLSKIENDKIEVTQHYAEVFAAVFGVNPLVFLYPDGEFKKSKELLAIERRAKRFRKHG